MDGEIEDEDTTLKYEINNITMMRGEEHMLEGVIVDGSFCDRFGARLAAVDAIFDIYSQWFRFFLEITNEIDPTLARRKAHMLFIEGIHI
jgi:hypothetical protein